MPQIYPNYTYSNGYSSAFPNTPMNGYSNPYQYSGNVPSTPQPTQMAPAMTWVDGDAAARSFQIPAGYPLGQPYPLWDSNDNIVYLKTMDQLGRPMPLKKLRYTVEEDQQVSGALPSAVDMSQYVTKNDMNELKNEIRDMFGQMRGQGQGQNQNRNNQNRNEQGGKQ